MPNRIPDPRAGGPEGNRLPGAVSVNRPYAEKVGAANAPATATHTHAQPLVGSQAATGVRDSAPNARGSSARLLMPSFP